jgi:hypothetical protein
MKTPNRDLLVLVKDEFPNRLSMEYELEKLNEILFRTETIENFCIASEVFDMNRYMVIEDRKGLARIFSQQKLKPFQFICNKN